MLREGPNYVKEKSIKQNWIMKPNARALLLVSVSEMGTEEIQNWQQTDDSSDYTEDKGKSAECLR